MPGAGKTALLRAWAEQSGFSVLACDCRVIEPTVAALQHEIDSAPAQADGELRVICLDHFEHFGLLEAWLRERLSASPDPGLRFVVASRQRPSSAWSLADIDLLEIPLMQLSSEAARELLTARGLDVAECEPILRLTGGHPFGLELAARIARRRDAHAFGERGRPELVHQLATYFLEGVDDAPLRESLEAAATVRRVTRPLLSALVDREVTGPEYEALAQLPLMEVRADGLSLHPTVHANLASWLHSTDPARFTEYRRRAHALLTREVRSSSVSDLWRYTADLIYLIQDPIVREAFFPSTELGFSVEPVRQADEAVVLSLLRSCPDAEEITRLERLFKRYPEGFYLVRDSRGELSGFSCLFDAAELDDATIAQDPCLRAWLADLPEELHEPGRVLFLRRWMNSAGEDAPSPEQAACWLDVKRTYLELRPALRRVYLAVSDLTPFSGAADKLGFVPVLAATPLPTAVLDLGPGSVDAWLSRILRAELGIEAAVKLDLERHSLLVEGLEVVLTAREIAVAVLLNQAEGSIVNRQTLLEEAWDGGEAVGSNVVEVVVRSLRKKLSDHADCIETVRGAGYRWIADE